MAAHPHDRVAIDDAVRILAQSASENVPGAEHASVTVRYRDGTLETTAATSDLARSLDELQYELREGPCYDAVTAERFVLVNDVEASAAYTTYGPTAARAGARAQLAMQLTHEDGRVAGLNLYASVPGVFTRDSVQMAELFSAHAATLLGYARQVDTLNEAVAARTEIGTAVGIVMERHGVDADRAFQYLVRLSNDGNVKLREIACRIVAEFPDERPDNAQVR
jgi:GAF domain-containing protein